MFLLALYVGCAPAPDSGTSAGATDAPGLPLATISLGPTGGDLGIDAAGASLHVGDDLISIHLAGAAPGRVTAGDCTGGTSPDRHCNRRIEIDHGDVVEWWEQRIAGLEHGFDVASGGRSIDLPVRFEGATLTADGPDVAVELPSGALWHYGGLTARDADDNTLAASMDVDGDTVWLHIDTDGAHFPVEIDPWFAAQGHLDTVGYSATILGDVNGDGYDDVAIGDRYAYQSYGYYEVGQVDVYHGSASGVSTTATTSIAGSGSDAWFGEFVLAGNFNGDGYGDLLAGTYESGSSNLGYLRTYHGSSSGISSTANRTLSCSTTYCAMGVGEAVADFNGDGYDDVAASQYSTTDGIQVFRGSSSGLGSTANQTISTTTADYPGLAAGDFDGDGDPDLAVGLKYYDYGQTNEGMLWLLPNTGGSLATTATWTWDSDQTNAYCGTKVTAGDFNGDGLADFAFSCPGYDDGLTDQGLVGVFYGSRTGFGSAPDWTLSGSVASANLGTVLVAISDMNGDGCDELAVTDASNTYGAVSLYYGAPSGLSATGHESWTGNADTYSLGLSEGGGGDVNGDGYGDLLLGYGYATYSSTRSAYFSGGGVIVYEGSAGGAQTGQDPDERWTYGDYQVAANAGDVDRDGLDDIVVGDFANGDAYVIYGGTRSDTTISTSYSYFGAAVSGAGDVDGDGYDDVIIGSYYYSSSSGAVWLYKGSATGISTTATTTWTGTSGNELGKYVTEAGDVNNDGYDDVLVGQPLYDSSLTNVGRGIVYYGYSGGLSSASYTSLPGTEDSEGAGSSVAAAGDVNGDGYDDVLVGASGYDGAGLSRGRVQLFLGSATGVSTAAAWSVQGADNEALGTVAGGGDANGDGFLDVLIASTGTDTVAVYLGDGTAFETTPTWTFSSSGVGDRVAFVPDRDGDGDDEITFSAYNYEGGRIWLFSGTPDGASSEAVYDMTEDGSSDDCGYSIDGLDFDGDGLGDLLSSCYNGDAVELWYGQPTDLDGDGSFTPTDCNDDDATIYPGAAELCDGLDNDCNGVADDGAPLWYADADHDGYGDPTASTSSCTAPSGYVADDTDCDDTDALTNPGGTEVCGGGDEDCDGLTDEPGASGAIPVYTDGDSDGYGAGASTGLACGAGVRQSTLATDCNDADAAVFPGADERCNGEDDNCNGSADEGTPIDAAAWYADGDADGYGAGSASLACTQPLGQVANATDCNDGDGAISPVGVETCDGIDQDCDGVVDDGATDATAWFPDSDSDGFGAPTGSVTECTAPSGYLADHTDCNDGSSSVNPGATESCNGVDDDCDGSTDEDGASGSATFYVDSDGDGFGSTAGTRSSCSLPSGYAVSSTDCNDADSAVHPGASELCDTRDNDCDGSVDEGTPSDATTWYQDADSDGHGSASTTTRACTLPPGYAAAGDDCDDTSAAVSPAAIEACNGVDDDCDGTTDESGATGESTWYADSDRDGLGSSTSRTACSAPSGYVATTGDCNDADATITTGGPWYTDADRDTFGDSTTAVAGCVAPSGKVPNGDDCDDNDATIGNGDTWYTDADGDGYGDPEAGAAACTQADGSVADDTDCDDTDATIHPDGEVWYDGIDEGCDGGSDYDRDGDGQDGESWGGTDCDDSNPAVYDGAADDPYDGIVTNCSSDGDYDADGDGHTSDAYGGDDCDDAASDVYPGAVEVWYDGVDADCDGNDDDQDYDGMPVGEDCDDTDPTVTIDCGNGDSGGDTDTGAAKADTGCGCSTSGPGAGGAALVLAGLLGLRRRRPADRG